jgi:hypothetical protein
MMLFFAAVAAVYGDGGAAVQEEAAPAGEQAAGPGLLPHTFSFSNAKVAVPWGSFLTKENFLIDPVKTT